MHPDQDILNQLVNRILKVSRPSRIILFGSSARGEMERDSDLDLLVILPDSMDKNKAWEAIYLSLFGIGVAKDLIVASETDVLRGAQDPFKIYHNAIREGRELYNADVA